MKQYIKGILFFLGLAYILTYCGQNKDDSEVTPAPYFSALWKGVFSGTCATNCHNASDTGADALASGAFLDLSAQDSFFAALKNQRRHNLKSSDGCSDDLYIKPNSASESILAAVFSDSIRNTAKFRDCSISTDSHKRQNLKLSTNPKWQQALIQWIDNGAEDN